MTKAQAEKLYTCCYCIVKAANKSKGSIAPLPKQVVTLGDYNGRISVRCKHCRSLLLTPIIIDDTLEAAGRAVWCWNFTNNRLWG